MVTPASMNRSDHIINTILLRLSMVILYIAAYRSLPAIKYGVSLLPSNPMIFFQFYEASYKKKIFADNYLRSFLIILMCIIVLLPIFKTLTAEIATDTIWFNFSICQVIYCIDSVRSSILQGFCPKRKYPRSYVIPLEESLLITKKISTGAEIANISAVLGFILLFSRIQNNFDIVYLQTIGFILYFFLPKILEQNKMYLSFYKTAPFLAITAAISFWSCNNLGILFSIMAVSIYLSLKAMDKLTK
ncbi:hypothetical protein PAEPH01_2074 [Pancytospora epiphaga]|nr:hypothetical protein PAEPH01_2074 [Pancytospora epiphaga]